MLEKSCQPLVENLRSLHPCHVLLLLLRHCHRFSRAFVITGCIFHLRSCHLLASIRPLHFVLLHLPPHVYQLVCHPPQPITSPDTNNLPARILIWWIEIALSTDLLKRACASIACAKSALEATRFTACTRYPRTYQHGAHAHSQKLRLFATQQLSHTALKLQWSHCGDNTRIITYHNLWWLLHAPTIFSPRQSTRHRLSLMLLVFCGQHHNPARLLCFSFQFIPITGQPGCRCPALPPLLKLDTLAEGKLCATCLPHTRCTRCTHLPKHVTTATVPSRLTQPRNAISCNTRNTHGRVLKLCWTLNSIRKSNTAGSPFFGSSCFAPAISDVVKKPCKYFNVSFSPTSTTGPPLPSLIKISKPASCHFPPARQEIHPLHSASYDNMLLPYTSPHHTCHIINPHPQINLWFTQSFANAELSVSQSFFSQAARTSADAVEQTSKRRIGIRHTKVQTGGAWNCTKFSGPEKTSTSSIL